jgi:hypothetical protein
MWWFPWGNGSNPHKTPTTQPFSFIFVAMIFFSNSTPLKYFRLVQWVSWYEQFVVKKWPARCTPQQIKHTRWQAPDFTSMDRARIQISYYVNFGACQSWRPCSIHIFKRPFFCSVSPLWEFTVYPTYTLYVGLAKIIHTYIQCLRYS